MKKDISQITDRRVIYTRNAIKDGLLTAMGKQSFDRLTISEVCRVADVSRNTFYLHYSNLSEVLDELFEDALNGTRTAFQHLSINCRFCEEPEGTSFCYAVRNSGKYRPLFHDNSISALFMSRIAAYYKEPFVEELLAHSRLTYRQAEAVFYFQINGCFAVCRTMDCSKTNDWPEIKKALDTLIKAGLKAIGGSVFLPRL